MKPINLHEKNKNTKLSTDTAVLDKSMTMNKVNDFLWMVVRKEIALLKLLLKMR